MNNQTITAHKNPSWWTEEYDSSWDRVKAAFKRDWDQTKHDLGGNQPDTQQSVKDTVKQASGTQAIPRRGESVYEKAEPAYRFGYGARTHYGTRYPVWNMNLENELRRDWTNTNQDADWESDSANIRAGWDYVE